MLLSRKRLHKIKKINNQSMKNKKGGKKKRKRKRNRSFRKKNKAFNLRNKSLKKTKGGGWKDYKGSRFFFLLPYSVEENETKFALVGVKDKKLSNKTSRKFAKSFSEAINDSDLLKVSEMFKNGIEKPKGYRKLKDYTLSREAWNDEEIQKEMEMIQALNHSLFQIQKDMLLDIKKSHRKEHKDAKKSNGGVDPCEKNFTEREPCNKDSTGSCRWSNSSKKCVTTIPKGTFKIFENIVTHIDGILHPDGSGEMKLNIIPSQGDIGKITPSNGVETVIIGSEDEPAPAIKMPESKDCENKRDCGDKFCLQPPEGGTGKCVPKPVYVSNMKARKGPKEVSKENLDGVGDMFKEDEPAPAIKMPESKDCENKRDCGDKFCLQPPEGGTGKCVPKPVYVSNMKARKGPKEVSKENLDGVSDMFKEDEPAPAIKMSESKDCENKRDCGDKFCLQPPEGGTGKCVPKPVYVSNMKARKGPKEVSKENLDGVGDMFKEDEPVEPLEPSNIHPSWRGDNPPGYTPATCATDAECVEKTGGTHPKCDENNVCVKESETPATVPETPSANPVKVGDRLELGILLPNTPTFVGSLEEDESYSWRDEFGSTIGFPVTNNNYVNQYSTNPSLMSLIKKVTVTVTKVDSNQYEIQELTLEELAGVPKTYGRDNTLHFSIKNGPKPKIKYEEIISINGVPVESSGSGGESKNTGVDPSTLPVAPNDTPTVTPGTGDSDPSEKSEDGTSDGPSVVPGTGESDPSDGPSVVPGTGESDPSEKSNDAPTVDPSTLPVAPTDGPAVVPGTGESDPSDGPAVVPETGDEDPSEKSEDGTRDGPAVVPGTGDEDPSEKSEDGTRDGPSVVPGTGDSDPGEGPAVAGTPSGTSSSIITPEQGSGSTKESEKDAGGERKNKSVADPVKYHQPWFQVRGQVYPGPYQPGFKIVGDTGVNFMPWLRHLGQPNPFAHYDGGPDNPEEEDDAPDGGSSVVENPVQSSVSSAAAGSSKQNNDEELRGRIEQRRNAGMSSDTGEVSEEPVEEDPAEKDPVEEDPAEKDTVEEEPSKDDPVKDDPSVTPETPPVEEPVVAPEPAPVVEEPVVAPEPAPVVEEPVVAPEPAPAVEEPVVAPTVEEPVVAPEPAPAVEEPVVAPAVDEPVKEIETEEPPEKVGEKREESGPVRGGVAKKKTKRRKRRKSPRKRPKKKTKKKKKKKRRSKKR